MAEPLIRSFDDGVATVTLNRPEVRNALSRDLRQRLRDSLAELNADPAVRAIVLTGTDPAFCAGVDLTELGDDQDLAPLTEPFVSSEVPLIGAINGPAYTGGLELALACHFLVASERATFADTHARLGLMPGWGLTVLLTEAVGSRRARQMNTTALPIDASTALAWGLVNRVVGHDQVLDVAHELARAVAANNPRAVRGVTQLHNRQQAARDAHSWELEHQAWIDPRATPPA